MATTNNSRPMRDTVNFKYNVPVEVALKFSTGKIIPTRNGDRVMFSTVDDRVMFLDLATAEKVNQLRVAPGETIRICKHREGRNVAWTAWLSPETEKTRAAAEMQAEPESDLERKLRESIELANQGRSGEVGNGTFVIPGAGGSAPAPAQATRATVDGKGHSDNQHRSTWGPLVGEAAALVDAFAATVEYSSKKHGNLVKSEDVRALLVTVYIQRGKGASHAA